MIVRHSLLSKFFLTFASFVPSLGVDLPPNTKLVSPNQLNGRTLISKAKTFSIKAPENFIWLESPKADIAAKTAAPRLTMESYYVFNTKTEQLITLTASEELGQVPLNQENLGAAIDGLSQTFVNVGWRVLATNHTPVDFPNQGSQRIKLAMERDSNNKLWIFLYMTATIPRFQVMSFSPLDVEPPELAEVVKAISIPKSMKALSGPSQEP
jgi:hypothetical protein